jgi:hypothetical protein
MQNRPAPDSEESKDKSTGQAAETRLKSAGEIVVEHHDTPPPGPADKQIHPRRRLPLVPAARPKPQANEDSDSDKGKGDT